jgi:branched-chain amino acid transport system substrate-binding protein
MRGVLRVLLLLALGGGTVRAQEAPPAHERYGGTPEEVAPFRDVEPARRFFIEPQIFRGPGREDPPPPDPERVVIGLVTPLDGYDAVAGSRIRRAVELAVERANAEGGFGPKGIPFAVAVRDEGARWGQAADAMEDLVEVDGAWAVMGGYEDANSHVLSRVVLKIQVPLVNTAGLDPTLTEHNIPWVLRNRPDDRQAALRLLRKVFTEDGRKRAVLFRANDRYGRTGVKEFTDAARRAGHPIPLETRFEPQEDDWAARLERIRAAKPDAVVIWGRPGPAGAALRALREGGIDLPCYGTDRLVDPRFLAAAGPAAEGFVVAYPFDPAAGGAAFESFRAAYAGRTGEEPSADAAYAYDGARMIVEAIRKAGLNRPRIMDALNAITTWTGVTGTARFDVTMNNVSKATLGRVDHGRFVLGK